MDTRSLALVFAIVALAISVAGHSPIALVVAIIALVLSQSDKEEVALILGIIALVVAVLLGSGVLIH